MEEKIDLKDRKILYELDKDSSQTNKQIARRVGASEMVVSNKIKRLIDKGVIENFYVKTNSSLLGSIHLKVYLRLHNITKIKERELLNHLKKQKNILWLASLRGKYDIVLSVYVKSISEFSEKYEVLFSGWHEYILDRNVVVLESASTYTKAYLLEKQMPEEIVYSEGEKINKVDKKDEELLKLLSTKSRMRFVDIANKLKVSADTVKYRIRNLEKKGIITGFGVKINFDKLSNNYHLIFLKLQNMDLKKYSQLKNLSKINKNVIVYIKTIGDHEAELEIETSNKEELDNLIKDLRDKFVNEIKDYELLEVTEEHLLNYYPF